MEGGGERRSYAPNTAIAVESVLLNLLHSSYSSCLLMLTFLLSNYSLSFVL